MAVERIKESKDKIDEDSVKATVNNEEIVKLKSVVDNLCSIFEGVKNDLITADKERALYSLVKNVKNVAEYPPPFGGKPNENIYTFKWQMLDALETNQIPERNKVKVLRKHLKGAPRESIGDDTTVKSVNEAFRFLIEAFGNPREIWSSIMNDFKRKYTNTRVWLDL